MNVPNLFNLDDISERLQRRILDFFYHAGKEPLSPVDCRRIAAQVFDIHHAIADVDWNEVAHRWNWEKDRVIGNDLELSLQDRCV